MANEAVLDKLASTLSDSDSLETLVRPLLELLELITGMESTYLTSIDLERGQQHLEFSRNVGEMEIPEGLTVPWGDTLCKRALDEGITFADDVPQRWGDSQAARQLGIATYLSQPVRTVTGGLYGTLSAASQSQQPLPPKARELLAMFARLIAHQLERDQLIARLKTENELFSEHALQDPLTGIPNRRAAALELKRALANAIRKKQVVHVGFIDLDGFKAINDQYGHDAGDRFLIEIARRVIGGMRDGDFIARYGGDEFVFFSSGMPTTADTERRAIQQRLRQLTRGIFGIGVDSLEYPGASVGVVTSSAQDIDSEELIGRADAAMYEDKAQRRRRAGEENQA